MVQNQSLVQFASGSAELVTYSNTVNTALIGTRIVLEKKAYESEVTLGSTITYNITATNTGNTAGSVILTDKLPEGTSFVANSVILNGTPMPGANPNNGIAIGNMMPQAQAQIIFQLIVVSIPSSLQLVNQAQADAEFRTAEGRIITSITHSNTLVTPVNEVSLSARLSASTEQTFVSEHVTYELTIVNDGNLSLREAVASFDLPLGILFVPGSVTINAVISPSADPNAGIPLGTIRPQSTIVITYRAQTTEDAASISISKAIVRYQISGTPDYTQSNEVAVILIQPEISVNKQVDPLVAVPGDVLHYSIYIDNASNVAVDAVMDDTLPAGTFFVPNSLKLNNHSMPGVFIEDGINLGTLLGQSQNRITFDAQIPLQLATVAPLTNTASVVYTFRLSDGRIVSNSAISNAAITEVAAPIIQLTAEITPPIVEYGDTITIVSTLINKGNLPAFVSFTSEFPYGVDLLPKTFRVDGARLSPIDYDGNQTWQLGIILPGATLEIIYSAIVTDAIASDEIVGYVKAKFSYEVSGQSYTGEALSNSLAVAVLGDDE
ncbi:DUF11 domain-containing protein [Paenibacillus sp. FSL A5-0031]|uniref:DUF11 domain-containing protein n=1 Tax=Paenibacillus sp. FSL A5-0031 TaxID=1920420 RepID=UPI0015C3EC34|nr:DUF11 domain-containing protein [Paenibacillus sp. FSL A5-0031]